MHQISLGLDGHHNMQLVILTDLTNIGVATRKIIKLFLMIKEIHCNL